ncbi:hypothetical protein SEA_CASSITA_85 [Microbacterium phage Cassita]|nr:hypothetical protein SEA_CASSITA_85 [Microbacterium phage Cassita]
MSVKDVETYWTAELNEEVEIIPVGWTNMPTEYALYIGGTHVVAYKRLEEVEDYLSRYFCVKGA